MSKFKALLRKFSRSQTGGTAVIFALSAVPLILAAGVGLDYIRATNLQTRMQGALDAAALAAAASANMTEAQRIKTGEAAFAINWRSPVTEGVYAKPVFNFGGNKVTATVDFEMPTSLMNLAGIDKMAINGSTTINIPEDKKAEIALVLDYSGSMGEEAGGQIKYIAMKNAAKSLINDLQSAEPGKIKIGLVPFSHHVWATLPKEYVKGQAGAGTWTGCTQDRLYPLNISDATPVPGNDDTKWGQPIAPTNHGDCSGYVPRKLVVRPLTTNFAALNTQLDQMRPYAYTHIALGAEFGWHMLSPNAPFAGSADYDDETTEKVLVILTDGRQTEPSFGPNGIRHEAQGEANLANICEAAKQKGVTVMTIAFDLQDQATTDRLRNCSTDPSKHFYIAEDGGDIARAFDEIRNQVQAALFISK